MHVYESMLLVDALKFQIMSILEDLLVSKYTKYFPAY